ncbi:MAG: nucleotidyltransferase [Caulobacter sp.]|nr:nucleotidyltransferase [Caulobacter sp.]
MAKTVDEAFTLFLSWMISSETENSKASSHRASIEACLKSNFGMSSLFRAGSYGHGTSVSGYSDVDYFAVIPANNLSSNSSTALRALKDALAKRFPNTDVWVDSPAVAVQFGTEKWERHEITPAYFIERVQEFNVYGMPNRYGDWMKSSPTGLNTYTNIQNDRLSKKAKHLVRLIKSWNYNCSAGLRSIYIELRVAEYLSGESSVIYPIDTLRALRHLQSKELASMRDPLGLGANIYPCSDAVKPGALSKLNSAVARATKAIDADRQGDTALAFEWWDKLFNYAFPSHY